MVKVTTHGFILKTIQWHIHAGSWSLVNCWWEALTRHCIGCSWILMNAAVGLMDGLGLDGDRCIRVIPRHYVRNFLPPANEVLGKVIFSQVSVFPQRGCVSHHAIGREVCIRVCTGEECVSLWVQGVSPWADTPRHTPPRTNTSPGQTSLRTDTPLGRHSPTGQTPLLRNDHWSGWYAFYWNAFLLSIKTQALVNSSTLRHWSVWVNRNY